MRGSAPDSAAVSILAFRRPGLTALRTRIAAIERGGNGARKNAPGAAPLGAAEIDSALPGGGLARGALHEIAAGDGDCGAAAAGFATLAAARAAGAGGLTLWCARGGDLYAPGLAAFGLDTARLIAARAARPEDALWTLEEALRAGAAAAVGEAAAGFAASRRLQLAARAGGGLCLLLPPPDRPPGALAAATRWRISAAPSAPRAGGRPAPPGAPRWRLALSRCRGGAPRTWTVEWHVETNRLSVATPLADRAEPGPRRLGRAG